MTKSLHRTLRPTGDSGKEWPKRWVFKRFLKTDVYDADVTFSDRAFQSRAAAVGVGVKVTIRLSVGLVCGYAHVFTLLTFRCHCHSPHICRRPLRSAKLEAIGDNRNASLLIVNSRQTSEIVGSDDDWNSARASPARLWRHCPSRSELGTI